MTSTIQEIADGLCLKMEGKMVSRREDEIDDSLSDGKASADSPKGESTESTVIIGVNIVMNHPCRKPASQKPSL